MGKCNCYQNKTIRSSPWRKAFDHFNLENNIFSKEFISAPIFLENHENSGLILLLPSV